MGTTALFPWLSQLYPALLAEDVRAQLPVAIPHVGITLTDARRLLGAASFLAYSTDTHERRMAYEIATRLTETLGSSEPSVVVCADVILSRIGNFPGRALLHKEQPFLASHRTPARLLFERLGREFENTVDLSSGREALLTDFQVRLLDELAKQGCTSVSAPTSAGKSFVLGLDLVRRLRISNECVVYLVPTRALIREVSGSLRQSLAEAGIGEIPIRSVPLPLEESEVKNGAVYVLTQERLLTLLSASHPAFKIDALFIDEAQNIQDGARGVVLQTAIERVSRSFPRAQFNFASPLSSNPEFLLSIVGDDTKGSALVETTSPVSQNIILVSPVKRQVRSAAFTLLDTATPINLGTHELNFEFRGSSSVCKARLARAVTGFDEACIVFANEPGEAEEIAKHLIDGATIHLSELSDEIEELIDYIRSDLHYRHPLIRCLQHRIAFHYGDMPALVRGRIEDLFRQGQLQFLCCTSTLLQGVNLPARHIVIENPKRGTSEPMPRRDFLNLAGRAGRLLKEFHGNVWCLRPEKWDEPSYQGETLVAICSAVQASMQDGGSLIQKASAGKANEKERDVADAITSKLYLDSQRTGGVNLDRWKNDLNEAALKATSDILKNIRTDLPLSIIEACPGLHPSRLQALLDFMLAAGHPESLLPLNPWTKGHYERMQSTIRLLELTFRDKDDQSYVYFTWLATQWVHEASLGQIVSGKITEDMSDREISTVIRNTLKTLEKEIRFRLVKFYSAYNLVLAHAMKLRNLEYLNEKIEPIPLYLECGSSSPTTLNLMALGLSRPTDVPPLSVAVGFRVRG